MSPEPEKPQVFALSRLWPLEVIAPEQLAPKVLFATIVFFSVIVAFAPLFVMPPPLLLAIVTFVSLAAVRRLYMAPLVVLPVKFALTVTFVRLRSPRFQMPPPRAAAVLALIV